MYDPINILSKDTFPSLVSLILIGFSGSSPACFSTSFIVMYKKYDWDLLVQRFFGPVLIFLFSGHIIPLKSVLIKEMSYFQGWIYSGTSLMQNQIRCRGDLYLEQGPSRKCISFPSIFIGSLGKKYVPFSAQKSGLIMHIMKD